MLSAMFFVLFCFLFFLDHAKGLRVFVLYKIEEKFNTARLNGVLGG